MISTSVISPNLSDSSRQHLEAEIVVLPTKRNMYFQFTSRGGTMSTRITWLFLSHHEKYLGGDTWKTEILASLVDCFQNHCCMSIDANDTWFILKGVDSLIYELPICILF